ncbi:hypothetical protein Hgul01_05350 [Herpetosiphon gulosus]|uniref:Uncharacterized protein n=1 Tax=Herpetosiphon gulosus TaxID=1973496 RepID=A0ABP9X803_9CHLR
MEAVVGCQGLTYSASWPLESTHLDLSNSPIGGLSLSSTTSKTHIVMGDNISFTVIRLAIDTLYINSFLAYDAI